LLKTYLILAQIRLDSKEFKEARDAVEPIVAVLSDAAKKGPIQLDKNMLDIFGAAVRADVGLNDFQKAGEHGGLLLEIGPDDPQINAVLVNFVQRLDVERKSIQETLSNLPDSTPPAEAERIRNNLASVKEMLADMLKKLASRQKMTPPTLVYIGNLFDAIDMANEAEQQYRSVLDRAKDDPEFIKDKENAKLVNAVRAKQVSILRKRGKYQEAVDVATNLINQFPNALEPLVERARIYQDWATRDPSKFDDAIAGWTEIRRRLDKTMARPEPKNPNERASYRGLQASYYEAIYNAASCLLAQAKRLQTSDKAAAAQKAKLGEQLLTAVLQSHPKLDGTEATQKKFTAIKAQLAAFRSPPMTAASPAR
jgi:tetratricopeptide (TPR) repeat protein